MNQELLQVITRNTLAEKFPLLLQNFILQKGLWENKRRTLDIIKNLGQQ